MNIDDFNDPNASVTGGNDFTVWLVMFGIIIVFVGVMLFINRNNMER